jgi:predicted  nucleic acid-binding Zn-ribbon protein
LRHRRETLPERDAMLAVEADLTVLEREATALRTQRDEVRRDEQKLDDEVTSIDEKANEVERRLYSGEISSPRELQAMQADVEQLRKHQRLLEDRELELMERRDRLDSQLGGLEERARELQSRERELRAALADAEGMIDREVETEQGARSELASLFTDTLLDEYERRRAHNRGSGAARLVGNSCQGCHLSIPSVEAERIRRSPPGTLATCDNCGCILVP